MSELTLAGLNERIGQELGISDWVAIDQERIDTFASCTGDRQWIHVDVERANRESPFRGPINRTRAVRVSREELRAVQAIYAASHFFNFSPTIGGRPRSTLARARTKRLILLGL